MKITLHSILVPSLMSIIFLTGCATTAQEEKISVFKQIELADQAYTKGKWVEAEQHYHSVTLLAPNDFYAWFRLGNTRLRQNRIEGAISAFQAALLRDSAQARTYYNLSIAYLLQAQKSLQESYQRLPEDDSGRVLIQQKLEKLRQIVYSPLRDLPSPAAGLLEQ